MSLLMLYCKEMICFNVEIFLFCLFSLLQIDDLISIRILPLKRRFVSVFNLCRCRFVYALSASGRLVLAGHSGVHLC